MGNRSQREILIENQIYLAGLDKDGFQVGLFTGIHGPARVRTRARIFLRVREAMTKGKIAEYSGSSRFY